MDCIFQRAKRREHKHVYFLRGQMAALQRRVRGEGTVPGDLSLPHYRAASQRSFLNWLKYDQYRKYLIFKKLHPFFVLTDVANFFDSVLHSHVAEAIHGLPIRARTVGLLFFLLERLSIRQEYAGSHGISLPTDEFDCSRTLAHMVLFPHDDDMVKLVGDENYVRWMDDQNMGVGSRAEGLRVLSEVGRSLSRLHLSPNVQKSRVLGLGQARRHFHLDLNELLDDAEDVAKERWSRPWRRKTVRRSRKFLIPSATTRKVVAGSKKKDALRRVVSSIWSRAKVHEGDGEFAKVLKRLYRLAGLAGARQLRRRASRDVLADPHLAERICDYMRCTGSVDEYLDFASSLVSNAEQIYPDISVVVVESLLRLEPSRLEKTRLHRLGVALLKRQLSLAGADDCAVIAPLLILRFGDGRSLRTLKRIVDDPDRVIALSITRACAIVYASSGTACFVSVGTSASKLLRNHLSQAVRFLGEIRRYQEVPNRYKARLFLSRDSVAGHRFVDMRVVLMARLLLLSSSTKVRDWVTDWVGRTVTEPISDFDKVLLRRLLG